MVQAVQKFRLDQLYQNPDLTNHFVDVNNDGDLDIYVSTVGDTRFYLYMNHETNKVSEEAVERGLSSSKEDGRQAGGFSDG